MKRTLTFGKEKIMNQTPVGFHCLGSYTGGIRPEVRDCQDGAIFMYSMQIPGFV